MLPSTTSDYFLLLLTINKNFLLSFPSNKVCRYEAGFSSYENYQAIVQDAWKQYGYFSSDFTPLSNKFGMCMRSLQGWNKSKTHVSNQVFQSKLTKSEALQENLYASSVEEVKQL